MKDEKLILYIKGETTSDEELEEILDWIESSEVNRKKYNELKNIWVLTGLEKQKTVFLRRFFSSKKAVGLFSMETRQALKYAAIVLLAMISGAFGFYLVNKNDNPQLAGLYNEIQVPNGQKSMIILYDGTKVWLNSGTSFKYPVVFKKETRDVFVSGEAFLDVAKNQQKPFIVHAGQVKVKVLGTEFDVYSYPSDKMLYTTLEKGHVKIDIAGHGNVIDLEPGQQFSFSTGTKKAKVSYVNTELFTSWKKNILRFENAELSEVLKKMERWYGVKFVINKKLDTSEKFTMSIKTESLREMLKVLAFSTGIKYEIKNDIVKISKP